MNKRRLHIFDISFAHANGAVDGRDPKYIEWYRGNLEENSNISFFTNDDTLRNERNEINYAWLNESGSICSRGLGELRINKPFAKTFDRIFTHDTQLLDKYAHACFVPGYGVWWGTELFGGSLNPKAYENKTKNISMMCSDKTMCQMHILRNHIARMLKNSGKVDCFGKFDGGPRAQLSDTLLNHRYCVAIENNIDECYFTEKILDCFASMTVPVYVGAPKIGKFFNEHGIIQIDVNDIFNIEKIIRVCSEFDYEARLPAIIENFNEVQKYLTTEDYICERYSF